MSERHLFDDSAEAAGQLIYAIENGFLKGASIQWHQWLGDNFETPKIVSLEFDGRITDVEESEDEYQIGCRGFEELLNVKGPRDIFQPSCRNILFDRKCGLNREDFGIIGTVSANSTKSFIRHNVTGGEQGIFQLGVLTFTSGLLNGTAVTIKEYEDNYFVPLRSLIVAPAAGDKFFATFGCDHSLSTCQNRFMNDDNFQGEPFIPTPETAV